MTDTNSNPKPYSARLNLTNPCLNKEGKIPKPVSLKEVLGLGRLVIGVTVGKKK